MKLIRFTTADSPSPCFGIVIRDQILPPVEDGHAELKTTTSTQCCD
jgi:hypothetical protein